MVVFHINLKLFLRFCIFKWNSSFNFLLLVNLIWIFIILFYDLWVVYSQFCTWFMFVLYLELKVIQYFYLVHWFVVCWIIFYSVCFPGVDCVIMIIKGFLIWFGVGVPLFRGAHDFLDKNYTIICEIGCP